MKKILAILLAAVMILGLLTACGEKPAQNAETKPEAAAETTAQPDAEKPAEGQPEGEKPADGEAKPDAEKPVDEAAAEAAAVPGGTTISVVSATVTPDAGSVEIPVKISGNLGLAGSLVTVSYDKALTLTGIKAGSALGSLTFTPGGDLTANPINMLWDGEKADNTNGDIAYLTFVVPKDAGDYTISLTGDPNNFYDNDLKNVPVSFAGGTVTVNAKN